MSKEDERAATIEQLRSWNELAEEIEGPIPMELAAALMSARPELLKTVKPRELTADEHKLLIDIIRVLMKTNLLLQRHAAQLADLVGDIDTHVKGLTRGIQQVEDFANFRKDNDDD